ncbi:CBS domain-containing protein [Halosquirtibacter xylanolyticus]|uniref:CBS domain-containing protein n=1 Tax=Halosquirtibacter xylanolyticus TaxID=3374599 RepID=UPI00374A3276|nr:CBS domain-containing protein [Prolixibacteraceae bacterium]
MIAKDLLEVDIPTLSEVDNGLKALSLMESVRITDLPVIQGMNYIGLISENGVLELNDMESSFESLRMQFIRPHVHKDEHLFEILGLMFRFRISILPVLDDQHRYIGSIRRDTVLEHFCDLATVKDPGALLVLEMPITDYSLTEISQIVESNNAKVLSLFVTKSESNNSIMWVTIKVNVMDVSSIVATFERYTYKIKGVYNDDSRVNDLYHDRFEEFMKYLDF